MGSGASTQQHHEIGQQRNSKFQWDPRMKNLAGTDMKSVLEVDLELKRIRKIADAMKSELKQGKHIAEAEAALVDTSFNGGLSKGREEVGKIRRLVTHVARINEVHKIFCKIDKDHSNAISPEEMEKFLSRFKIKKKEDQETNFISKKIHRKISQDSIMEAKAEARRIFNRADMDYSHSLDFHEFYEFVMTLFHVAFDKIDVECKNVIESKHFGRMLEFIYGENLGVSSHLNMTDEGKMHTMRRQMREKLNQLRRELGRNKVDRELFIDYLLHCYSKHHCSRLYYNLMHLTVEDVEWSVSKAEAFKDVKQIDKIEQADNTLEDVETTEYSSVGFKMDLEKEILDGATCKSP